MSPELLAAVRERIQIGHTKAEIVAQLEEAGYDAKTIEYVYEKARDLKIGEQEGSEQTHTSSPGTPAIVGYNQLLSQAWSLFTERWKLFAKGFALYGVAFLSLAIVFGLVVFSVRSFVVNITANVFLVSVIALLVLVVLVVFLLALRVISFSVIKSLTATDTHLSFTEQVRWSVNHIVPVVVVGLLSYFVVQTGNILVIPGIIASIYLFFSSYVYATEGVSGLDALVRSSEIVYNRWWATLGRILYTTLVLMVCFIASIILVALVGMVFPSSGPVLNGLLLLAAASYVGFLFVLVSFATCVSVVLFGSLKQTVPVGVIASATKERLRFWFKVAAIIGPLAMVLLQGPGMYAEIKNVQDNPLGIDDSAQVRMEVAGAVALADVYKTDTASETFVGLCAYIVANLETQEHKVSCNENEDDWAVAITGFDATYCADSTTFNKEIFSELGERTQCLLLPEASELEEQVTPAESI